MTSTAQHSREIQFLQITETGIIDRKNPRDVTPDTNQVFSVFESASPFYYRDRVRVSLKLSKAFRQYFALVRGIIEFNNLARFKFEFYRSEKSIDADFHSASEKDFFELLDNVSQQVRHELQFRHALKIVLDFETRYRLEKESVYSVLHYVNRPLHNDNV
jgi:hypothetical protein